MVLQSEALETTNSFVSFLNNTYNMASLLRDNKAIIFLCYGVINFCLCYSLSNNEKSCGHQS